jgi:hypothetical protein
LKIAHVPGGSLTFAKCLFAKCLEIVREHPGGGYLDGFTVRSQGPPEGAAGAPPRLPDEISVIPRVPSPSGYRVYRFLTFPLPVAPRFVRKIITFCTRSVKKRGVRT